MSLKILAVDDSATMRAIFQMTFAGEDAKVVAVEDAGAALDAVRSESPDVVIVDTSLTFSASSAHAGGYRDAPGKTDGDGYDLVRALKSTPGLESTRVLLLASQHHPFNEARAKESGVDDHVLKPFDTQHLIDRVTRLVVGSPSLAPAAPSPAAARPASIPASVQTVTPTSARPPAESTTQSFDERPSIIMTSRPASSEAPAKRVSETVARTHDEALAGKLDDLGLSAEQISAVLALSRDVVERVVWEVVPDLAETIIREEIKRLTAQ